MKKLLSILMAACMILTAVVLVPVCAGAVDGNALPTPGTVVDYFLVGDFCGWDPNSENIMTINTESFDTQEEYMITGVALEAGSGIKVFSSNDEWFKPGTDNNLIVPADGYYDVYFRPAGYDEWTYYYITLTKVSDLLPATPDEATPGEATPDEATPDEATPDEATPGEATPDEPATLILGDVDRSGKVNVFDASYILKGTTGTNGYPDYSKLTRGDLEVLLADVDRSGTVNVFDAALVLRFTTGDSAAIALGIGAPFSV